MEFNIKSFNIIATICIIMLQLFICFKIVTFPAYLEGVTGEMEALSQSIATQYSQLPQLTQTGSEPAELPDEKYVLYITGAVNTPGIYEISQGSRISDLISLAGGAAEDADLEAINLAAYVEDARHVRVPAAGSPMEEAVEVFADSEGSSSASAASGSDKPAYTGPVNINTANRTQLMSLPGIGEAIAQNIINYREHNGPFTSKDAIKKVNRIGDALYNNIVDMITI